MASGNPAPSLSDLCRSVEKLVPVAVGRETWYLVIVSVPQILTFSQDAIYSESCLLLRRAYHLRTTSYSIALMTCSHAGHSPHSLSQPSIPSRPVHPSHLNAQLQRRCSPVPSLAPPPGCPPEAHNAHRRTTRRRRCVRARKGGRRTPAQVFQERAE